MANEDLKNKINLLKKEKKDRQEKIKLEKELKIIEDENRDKSKSEKIIKGIGKGILKFGKFTNKVIEKQAKKKR